MKGNRLVIGSTFLFLVFLSSNTYTVCHQYLDQEITNKVCYDFQSDIEEEISDLSDYEQDDTHPGFSTNEDWHKRKQFINTDIYHSVAAIAHSISTPPPELFS